MQLRRYLLLLVLAITISSVSFTGCGDNGEIATEGLGLGNYAPSFTLPDYLTGKDVTFPADYQGRKKLLFFLSFG